MTKVVELDVDIADSPAETLNVYLGGVGIGRAGPRRRGVLDAYSDRLLGRSKVDCLAGRKSWPGPP